MEREIMQLSIRGLEKSFGDNTILRGLDLDVRKGEVVVILGPSGCGKSTLLRCINGLETIDSGEIWLRDEKISGRVKDLHLVRQKIGMVFQSYDLFPHMKVMDNLLLGPTKALSLPRQEYSCTMVYDGIEACDMLKDHRFDLILLDVMLPGADGFEIMDYIRPSGTPVIFITARRDLNDRVRGLELGADDYIVKPFEVIELRARVEAVMRRYGKTRRLIEVGGLRIDTASRQVFRGKEEIRLTKKEFDLLLLNEKVPKERLKEYDQSIINFYSVFEQSYVAGCGRVAAPA